MPPAFLITIDTEGDNLWARPRTVSTRNAGFMARFQAAAEKHGWRPTWLVNWEMAHDLQCVELLRDVAGRGVGEIGLHLHAWDTPPLISLTEDDTRHHPYLTEYPEPMMKEKILRLAGKLEEVFQQPVRSHRGGRWAFNGIYARLLRERGLTADCSVCPGVDWRSTKGAPKGSGGPDYRDAPTTPYFVGERNITQPASAPMCESLLEVPMTTGANRAGWQRAVQEVFSPRHFWLRPNGRNGAALRERVDEAVEQKKSHAMFMLHSSELMPAGSPTFQNDDSIERLYDDLEALFAHAARRGCRPATVDQFAQEWRAAAVQSQA